MPNDLEMRLYVVRGEIAHVVYTDFDVDNWYAAQRDGGFTKGPESFSMCGRAEAIAQWLDGDEACMVDAEEQASPGCSFLTPVGARPRGDLAGSP